jgi:hypothetical protein
MPTPLVRARCLAPALMLALAACARPSAESQLEAHQAAVDPPRLWRVEALDANGAVASELLVCADSTLKAGFTRANAEADGRPCLPFGDYVDRPGVYAVRCVLDDRRYGLTVNRTGDPDRDFTAAFALTALDGSGQATRQVRRYRQVGPCPAGWGIGDQARPGQRRRSNALAASWAGS